jgi:hypothetical protein
VTALEFAFEYQLLFGQAPLVQPGREAFDAVR